MSNAMTYVALMVMIATAFVLLLGLTNLMKGGPSSRSQRLMQARVMLQGLAVLLIVGVLLLSR